MQRFFRFSIRDLFWLTLVVAMGLGWWIDRQRSHAELKRASEREKAQADLASVREKKSENAMGLLESVLNEEGWKVERDPELWSVTVSKGGARRATWFLPIYTADK